MAKFDIISSFSPTVRSLNNEQSSLFTRIAFNASGATQSRCGDNDYKPFTNQSNWSSRPLLSITNEVNYPSRILSELRSCQTLQDCGYIPSINHYWSTVDNKLFFWCDGQGDVITIDSLPHTILSLCVCNFELIKGSIFHKEAPDLTHILVICTTSEVVCLPILSQNNFLTVYEANFRVASGGVYFYECVCSDEQRIFLSGSDGNVYDLAYQNSSWLSGPIQKLCLTSSWLGSYLSSKWSTPDPISQMLIDNERHLLYCRTESHQLNVFKIGNDCSQFEQLGYMTNGDVSKQCRDLFPNIETNAFSAYVSMSLISCTASHDYCLLVITKAGVRLYFSCYRDYRLILSVDEARNRVCSHFRLAHVRAPPGRVAPTSLDHDAPKDVTLFACHTTNMDECVLMTNNESADVSTSLWSLSTRLAPPHHYIETVWIDTTVRTLPSKIIKLLPLEDNFSLRNDREEGFASNLMEPLAAPRRYLALTQTAAYTIVSQSPVQVLKDLLMRSSGVTTSAHDFDGDVGAGLTFFVATFNNLQCCQLAVALFCDGASSPDVCDKALRFLADFGAFVTHRQHVQFQYPSAMSNVYPSGASTFHPAQPSQQAPMDASFFAGTPLNYGQPATSLHQPLPQLVIDNFPNPPNVTMEQSRYLFPAPNVAPVQQPNAGASHSSFMPGNMNAGSDVHSQQHMQQQQQHQLHQYNVQRLAAQTAPSSLGDVSTRCQAVVLCVARLLHPLWDRPIFEIDAAGAEMTVEALDRLQRLVSALRGQINVFQLKWDAPEAAAGTGTMPNAPPATSAFGEQLPMSGGRLSPNSMVVDDTPYRVGRNAVTFDQSPIARQPFSYHTSMPTPYRSTQTATPADAKERTKQQRNQEAVYLEQLGLFLDLTKQRISLALLVIEHSLLHVYSVIEKLVKAAATEQRDRGAHGAPKDSERGLSSLSPLTGAALNDPTNSLLALTDSLTRQLRALSLAAWSSGNDANNNSIAEKLVDVLLAVYADACLSPEPLCRRLEMAAPTLYSSEHRVYVQAQQCLRPVNGSLGHILTQQDVHDAVELLKTIHGHLDLFMIARQLTVDCRSPQAVVDLCLFVAQKRDPSQLAALGVDPGANPTVSSVVPRQEIDNAIRQRATSYEPILWTLDFVKNEYRDDGATLDDLLRHSCQATAPSMTSEGDVMFHHTLYNWMLSRELTAKFFSGNADWPNLDSFLRKNFEYLRDALSSPTVQNRDITAEVRQLKMFADLLSKVLLRQKKSLMVADLFTGLAKDVPGLVLADRLDYLSHALVLLKSNSGTDDAKAKSMVASSVFELEELCEVGQLQSDILDTLKRKSDRMEAHWSLSVRAKARSKLNLLSASLLTVQTIYDEVCCDTELGLTTCRLATLNVAGILDPAVLTEAWCAALDECFVCDDQGAVPPSNASNLNGGVIRVPAEVVFDRVVALAAKYVPRVEQQTIDSFFMTDVFVRRLAQLCSGAKFNPTDVANSVYARLEIDPHALRAAYEELLVPVSGGLRKQHFATLPWGQKITLERTRQYALRQWCAILTLWLMQPTQVAALGAKFVIRLRTDLQSCWVEMGGEDGDWSAEDESVKASLAQIIGKLNGLQY